MGKNKPIYMESTEIDAARTAAEVSSVLVQAGATSVSIRYDNGKIIGMSWTMRIGQNELPFAMPARVRPVYELLKSRRTGQIDRAADARILAQAEVGTFDDSPAVDLKHFIAYRILIRDFNPWCGICRARECTWTYEDKPTKFATMEEALPELRRLEAEQAHFRSVLQNKN